MKLKQNQKCFILLIYSWNTCLISRKPVACCNSCNNWTFENCSWEIRIWLVSSFFSFFFLWWQWWKCQACAYPQKNIVLISFSEAGKLWEWGNQKSCKWDYTFKRLRVLQCWTSNFSVIYFWSPSPARIRALRKTNHKLCNQLFHCCRPDFEHL